MTLPNKLTIFRIILAPIFLALLVIEFPHHYLIALAVFVVASLTDMYDGKIARSRGLITVLGKFLDPLADKMLTTAAFLGFMVCGIGGMMPMMWVNFIVLTREFLVASVRFTAASKGTVLAANIYGKIKTVSQMVAIIMAIFFEYVIGFDFLPDVAVTVMRVSYIVVIWFSTAMTVVSGVIYALQNKDCWKSQ